MQNRTFQTSVATDRTQYTGSRAVEIWVKLTNVSPVVASYRVVDGFEYELKVRHVRSQQVVWRWSKGKPIPPNLTVTLKPGEFREHRELWDRRDDSGRPVPAGLYEVEATHTPQTQPARVQIYLAEQGQPSEPGPVSPPESPKPGLVGALVVVPNPARLGATVELRYTVTNRGKAPAQLSFSSGKQFEIETVRPLWKLSQGQLYTQAFTTLALEQGASRTFSAHWTLPKELPLGPCGLSAYLTPVGGAKQAVASATLQVVR